MRPIVLTFVRHYLPGYRSGGPVRTIANLVEALADDVDFRIVTSDRDAADVVRYPHLSGENSRWLPVGHAMVRYLSPAERNLLGIGRVMRETPHDAIYLNSFLDPIFTAGPLLVRKLGLAPRTRAIIAPRGEFASGALRLKSLKKRVFIAATGCLGLYRDLVWQASSQWEVDDIRRGIGHLASDIRIAANLAAPSRASLVHRSGADGDVLRIVFLSRISPMKNLHYALEVLQRVRGPVLFDIYGPVRDERYWGRCRELMAGLPANVKVAYHGSVEPDAVASILAGYDVLFLPTIGENYGHVIIESLSAGTPVLISDTTPWRNLAESGVGWDLPLQEPSGFSRRIDELAELTSAEWEQMRRRSASFAAGVRNNSGVVVDNRRLFSEPTAA